jgi:hypothetical protein
LQAAEEACKRAALLDHTSIVKQTSTINRIYFICKRHRKYEKPKYLDFNNRKRKTFTKRCSCKVRFVISKKFFEYRIKIINSYHNHEKSKTAHVFSENRKLNSSQLKFVKALLPSNPSNIQILQSLRHSYDNIFANKQDIMNLKNKIKKENNNYNNNEIQIILEHTEKLKWYSISRIDENNCITALLVIPRSSSFFLQLYGSIIVIDATYKTNKNHYPLVEGIGISNTFQSFNAFFCFISSETENDYIWIMKGLKSLLGSKFYPKVFATDRDKGLMNSVKKEFPEAALILCSCLSVIYFLL